jgi:hypothetical protein
MTISILPLVLASQLIVTVAGKVPNFNIERGCKIDSASAIDPNAGLTEAIKKCADDEQKAKDQLQTQWTQYAPSEKKICMGLTTGDASNPPSYLELETCLYGQRLVRPKDQQVRRVDSSLQERDRAPIRGQ